MDVNKQVEERIEIFNDAVRMIKAPKRVPFATNDAFWRYYDFGYKLSDALFDPQSIEDAVIKFQQRYNFDVHLDIGDRNPLIATRSLGNFEYQIDDKNNTLYLKEQCHFKQDDYDKFVKNPVKTFWEEIIPRKYAYYNADMELSVLQNTLTKFLEFGQSVAKTEKRLKEECGLVPLCNAQNGGKIRLPFEILYNFLRGMQGLSRDLRTCPEKVIAFCDVFFETYSKRGFENIKHIENPSSCFTVFATMLSQNMFNKKQYELFYKKHFDILTDKIVETNSTMFILSEGTTKHLTEYLQQLPKGHFCIYVESDDIFETRKRFPNLCLWGGLPLSLLSTGTKQECIDYTKKLIDEVGTNGGLILCTNRFTSSPRDCNRDNLLAVSEFVRNYR